MLSEVKKVICHNDGTFSFVSETRKIRIELNKEGIEYIGGLDELKKFLEEIKSGRRKVKIGSKAIKRLENTVNWTLILS